MGPTREPLTLRKTAPASTPPVPPRRAKYQALLIEESKFFKIIRNWFVIETVSLKLISIKNADGKKNNFNSKFNFWFKDSCCILVSTNVDMRLIH